MQNKYIKYTHFLERKFREILRLFRERIVDLCISSPLFKREVEIDESFFGAKRIKGKRDRGVYGKTIVFGIYKRNGGVHTEVVENCFRSALQAVIKGNGYR